MRIVNSDGELVEYNKDKDPEMMKAVQVSSQNTFPSTNSELYSHTDVVSFTDPCFNLPPAQKRNQYL